MAVQKRSRSIRRGTAVFGAVVISLGVLSPAPQAVAAEDAGFDASPNISTEPLFTEPEMLAEGGTLGFNCYRIPSLGVATDGKVLASWDGRPDNCADSPQANSIVGMTSADSGDSWSSQEVIAAGQEEDPRHGFSDPSVVVDWQTDDVFNFHVKSFDAGFRDSVSGSDHEDRKVIQAAYAQSADQGVSWDPDHVITGDITTDPSWNSRFATSGNGIQIQYGQYRGRLIQPATVRMNNGRMAAVAWISDDHGASWYPSAAWGTGMDENKIVELSDGRLMNNSRASDSNTYRKISYSTNGGITWTEPVIDEELPDPRNNASIIRAFPNAPQGSAQSKVLLFSNTATTSGRNNGTIRMSCDDGETWPVSKVFEPGAVQYTSMATLPDGNVGLLWENNDGNIDIFFSKFNLAWLGEGCLGVSADHDSITAGETTELMLSVTNTLAETIVDRRLDIEVPEGWTATAPHVTLAPGETIAVPVTVEVPESAAAGSVRLGVSIRDGAATYTGFLNLLVDSDVVEVPSDEPTVVASIVEQKSTYQPGDVIRIHYRVSNPTDQILTALPKLGETDGFMEANVSGFDPDKGAPNCRYRDLAAGGSYTCSSTTYKVTDEDLDRGYIELDTAWDFVDGTNSVVWTATESATRVRVTDAPVIEEPLTPAVVAIDPLTPLQSVDSDPTTTVTARITLDEGELPAGSSVAFYLDGAALGETPVDADGTASTQITVPHVGITEAEATHTILARLILPAGSTVSPGRDGTATVTVLPQDRISTERSISVVEHPSVVSGGEARTVTFVAKAAEPDGTPVPSNTPITFTVNGEIIGVSFTDAAGIALRQYILDPATSKDQEYDVTLAASVEGAVTDTTDVAGAEASSTFSVLAHETEQESGSSFGLFGAILAVLGVLGGAFGFLLNAIPGLRS